MQLRAPKRWPLILLVALGALAAGILAHDVSTEVTPEDKTYAGLILTKAGYDPATLGAGNQDFEAQVRTVLAVQDAVLKAAPDNRGLPFGSDREPKDLLEHGYGLCYDRSRAIEKILGWLGFTTRHVAVYSTAESSALSALVTPQVASHAVTEVRTQKGWMLIDSNARWIGLDAERTPVSLGDIQATGLRSWAADNRDPIDKIFRSSFIQIRGLYSRHGYFYRPFTPVPDFSLRQLLSNVTD